MTKEQYEDVMVHLNDKETKYNDLVWYARTKLENIEIPGVKENIERIESVYPDEIENLVGDFGTWEHGFNSGILAGIRYAVALMEEGVAYADGEFPDLDS